MFDIGWSELVLIAIVALIVVGPKELPGLFRTVGRYMGKARAMAREFQRSMEQAADESGLGEASKSLNALNRLNANATARKYAERMVGEADASVKPAAAVGAVASGGAAGAAKATSGQPAAPAKAATPAASGESTPAPTEAAPARGAAPVPAGSGEAVAEPAPGAAKP